MENQPPSAENARNREEMIRLQKLIFLALELLHNPDEAKWEVESDVGKVALLLKKSGDFVGVKVYDWKSLIEVYIKLESKITELDFTDEINKIIGVLMRSLEALGVSEVRRDIARLFISRKIRIIDRKGLRLLK